MRKLLIVFVCMLLFPLISMDISTEGFELVPEPSSLDTHDPIHIEGDAELVSTATIEGWSGNGSLMDPIRIENLSIDGSVVNRGIWIQNTTSYIMIYNCTVFNSTSGISLQNSTNITVSSTTCFGNSLGLGTGGSGILVIDSNLSWNNYGMNFNGANNNTITRSIVSNNSDGGIIYSGQDIEISFNLIERNNGFYGGINTNFGSRRIKIYNNTIMNHAGRGFHAGWENIDLDIFNNTFLNNIIGVSIYNGGLFSEWGILTSVHNNLFINHSDTAIYSYRNCEIRDNICMNGGSGITGSFYAHVTNNDVSNFSKSGISGSTGSSIEGNTISHCNEGVMITGNDCIIRQNLIQDNIRNGTNIEGNNHTSEDNLIQRNGGNGSVISGTNHLIYGNVISENGKNGLLFRNAYNISIDDIHIYENQLDGISFNVGANITIHRSDVHDNILNGISITDATNLQVFSTYIYGNNETGISTWTRGSVHFESLNIFDSETGIFLGFSPVAQIDDCSFMSLETGLNVWGQESLKMKGNSFDGCGIYFQQVMGGGGWNLSGVDLGYDNEVNGRFIYFVNESFPLSTINGYCGQLFVYKRGNVEILNQDLSRTTIGMQIIEGDSIRISNCSFDRNLMGAQIFDGKEIWFYKCSFDRLSIGLEFYGSDDCDVRASDFTRGSGRAIYISSSTKNTLLFGNLFFEASGISSFAVENYGQNLVAYLNQFIYNRGTHNDYVSYLTQAWDEGVNSQWSYMGYGNYWRDHHYPDVDDDGTVDSPYHIEPWFDRSDPIPDSRSPLFEPPDINVTRSLDGEYIEVRWEEPDLREWSEVVEYRIYRREFPSDRELLTVLPDNSRLFIDNDVEYGKEYRYTMTAVNEFVESDMAPEAIGLLDVYLPTLYILEPLDGTVTGDDRIFAEWIGVDNESGIDHFEVRLDLGDWLNVGLSTSYTFFDLSEGTHILKIKVIDNAGGEVVEQVMFLVDMGKPTVSIDEPGHGSILSENHTIVKWYATDDLSTIEHYEVSVDNGTFYGMNLTRSIELIDLFEGVHTIKVIAFDMGGNFDIAMINFTVDSIDPTVSIDSPDIGLLTPERNIRISWKGYDVGTGIYNYLFKLDDQDWIDVGLDVYRNLWQLSDGNHDVWVQIRDRAGNFMIDKVNFTIDGSPPDLEITFPANGAFVSQSPVYIQWSVSDSISGVSHVQYLDNTSAWQNVTGFQFPFLGLEEDTYTVTLRAFDKVGNSIEGSTTFTVDRTPPEIIGYGPEGEDIALDEPIFVSFSERMQKGGLVLDVEGARGSVVWRGERAFFEPQGDLEPGRTYNVSVSGTDLAGNYLEPLSWQFNTTVLGKIRGRVIEKDGSSVPDAQIEINDSLVETRPDGGFVIELENGIYELKVSKNGFKTQTIVVNVTAGKINDIPDIILKRSDDGGIDWLKVLLIPLAILLMVILAFIGGTLISRKGIYIDEE